MRRTRRAGEEHVVPLRDEIDDVLLLVGERHGAAGGRGVPFRGGDHARDAPRSGRPSGSVWAQGARCGLQEMRGRACAVQGR